MSGVVQCDLEYVIGIKVGCGTVPFGGVSTMDPDSGRGILVWSPDSGLDGKVRGR
jgi:hypothetical protein